MDEKSRLAGMNSDGDGIADPAMSAAAPSAELPVSRGLPTERRRLARPRNLVILVALALIAVVAACWPVARSSADEPWCVWATPTGAMLAPSSVSVPEFGDVRDAPGGRTLDGHWRAIAAYAAVGGTRTGPVPGLLFVRNPIRWRLGLDDDVTTWEATKVERIGADGRTATAFVRSHVMKGLRHPTPDASVAGMWDLDDGSGSAGHLGLNADGTVEDAPGAIWCVRDGALVIDRSVRGQPGARTVSTYVLSEDCRAFDGAALHPAHGTKVE